MSSSSQSYYPCYVPCLTAAYSELIYSRGFHSKDTILTFYSFKIASAKSLM